MNVLLVFESKAQAARRAAAVSSRPFERRALGWEFPPATSDAEV